MSSLKLLRVKLKEDNAIIDLRELSKQDVYVVIAVDDESNIKEMFTVHGRYLKQQNFITFQSLKKLLKTMSMAGVEISPVKVEVVPKGSELAEGL